MTSPLDALEALEREATRGLRARALLAAPDAPRNIRTCNGWKMGTTPSGEGTGEPCEHARWDDGPWDVGDGRGQWRFPEGHGADAPRDEVKP